MKVHLVGLAVVFLSTLTATACGGGGGDTTEASGDAPGGLLEEGKLKVCLNMSYPPMEFFENETSGDIVGFDADGAREVADLWGLDVEFVQLGFDGLLPGLDAGRCDILWSALFINAERLEVADAVGYLKSGPGLIVRADEQAEFASKLDLCGHRLAIQAGSATVPVVNALDNECTAAGEEGVDISEYPQPLEAVNAVANGKADGALDSDVSVANMVSNNENVVAVDDIFPADTTFGVFVDKDGALKAPLTEALTELAESGTLGELAEKYGLSPENIVSEPQA